MTELNAVLLHVAEIEARYEEHRRRRADAWRSMEDLGWLIKWVRILSADLAELRQTCTCGATYATFEGPEPDCPVHGAVRALNQANARIAAADQEAVKGIEAVGFTPPRYYLERIRAALREVPDGR